MGDIIPSQYGQLIGFFHNKDGLPDLPKPFEHDVFLFETHVAGVTHLEMGIEELEKILNLDDQLTFYREPDNQHDNHAIVIKNANDKKIGYVPKADNIVFSRLMDAGKFLYGKIASIEKREAWLKIGVKIFLRE